jgi:hypothetical protein
MRFVVVGAVLMLSLTADATLFLEQTIDKILKTRRDVLVSVDGEVAAIDSEGIVVTDGTNRLRVVVWSRSSFQVGDRVSVSGKVVRPESGAAYVDSTGYGVTLVERAASTATRSDSNVPLPVDASEEPSRVDRVPWMLNVVAGAAVVMALVVFAVRRKQKLRGGIFISYRRGVASAYVGRLAEALEARFGRRVFIDLDGLAAGEDFVTGIHAAVRTSSVVLVVMHEGWVDYRNAEGARSLDDPDDFVRFEIAAALSAGIRIVPLLMNGAAMPREDRLPADIAPLARRQALVIRDADWQYHIEKLTKAIASSLPRRRWVPVAIAIALAAIAAVAAGVSYSLRRATPETSHATTESSGTSTAIVKDPRFH